MMTYQQLAAKPTDIDTLALSTLRQHWSVEEEPSLESPRMRVARRQAAASKEPPTVNQVKKMFLAFARKLVAAFAERPGVRLAVRLDPTGLFVIIVSGESVEAQHKNIANEIRGHGAEVAGPWTLHRHAPLWGGRRGDSYCFVLRPSFVQSTVAVPATLRGFLHGKTQSLDRLLQPTAPASDTRYGYKRRPQAEIDPYGFTVKAGFRSSSVW